MHQFISQVRSGLNGSTMLIVTDSRVWATGGGTYFRFAGLVSALRRYGIQVDLVTSRVLLPNDIVCLRAAGLSSITTGQTTQEFVRSPNLRSQMRRFSPSVVVAALRKIRRVARQLGSAFTGNKARVRTASDLQSPLLSLLVADYVKKKCPDFVLVEYLVHSYALKSLKGKSGCVPFITMVDTHDVRYQRCESFAAHGNPLPYSLNREEEQEMLKAFDIIIAIQDEDRKTFEAMLPGSTVVTCLPPCARDSVMPSAARRPKSAAFFGGKESSSPNEDGLALFLTHAWPFIRKAHPTATLRVYGDTRDAFKGKSYPGVSFEGFVVDLREAYAQTEIVISPMTYGSGLKTKILEALAYGRPVVATTHSAIGFPDSDGQGLLVAGDWPSFASAMIDLFADAERMHAFGRSAADYVARHFNEDRVMQDLLAAMRMHLERRRAHAKSEAAGLPTNLSLISQS